MLLPTVPENEGHSATTTVDPIAEANAAQQSIILLEEVDILFAEDGGFWQTVVALIRDSRRPVVMTCNGDYKLSLAVSYFS